MSYVLIGNKASYSTNIKHTDLDIKIEENI